MPCCPADPSQALGALEEAPPLEVLTFHEELPGNVLRGFEDVGEDCPLSDPGGSDVAGPDSRPTTSRADSHDTGVAEGCSLRPDIECIADDLHVTIEPHGGPVEWFLLAKG